MNKKINVFVLLGISFLFVITSCVFAQDIQSKKNVQPQVEKSQVQPAINISPIEVVNNTALYLNKRICMQSKFSKFSTLGLDYKPAYRSSENYISFLFLRDNSLSKIPLSELKMFLPRKLAEKITDVKEGDTVKVTGKVFSNALGDAWFEADTFEVVK